MKLLFAIACLIASSVNALPSPAQSYNATTGFVSAEIALPQCAPTDNAGDCQALVAFAYATKFETWTKNDNWCLGGTICAWLGVTCTGGRVTSLNFGNQRANHIVGKFPDQFSELTELTELYIENNDLSAQSEFPNVLQYLTKLRTLSLSNNSIPGILPDWIGTLTNLQIFYVWGNSLHGAIPGSLGNLQQLRHLSINDNQFSGISNDICNLPPAFFLTKICSIGRNQFSCPLPYCVAKSPSSNTVCDATCT